MCANALAFRIDPANEDSLGHVPEMGITETKEAIDAAHTAFKSWSQTNAKVRSF